MVILTLQVDSSVRRQVEYGPDSSSRRPSTMNFHLSACIAVSCLAHASLLLWANHPPPPQLHIGGDAEALQVTLEAQPAPVPNAKEVAALETVPLGPSPPLHQHTVTRSREATRRPPARPSARPPAEPATDPTATVRRSIARPAQVPPRASSLNVSERVSAALQSQLAECFEYPWLARKRGWQGLVTLSLHIDENGGVSQWRIARTSGYNVLDRSALEAAKRIDRLQQADRLLNGKPLNLSIPVRYQLIDS
jgi:protein TonB